MNLFLGHPGIIVDELVWATRRLGARSPASESTSAPLLQDLRLGTEQPSSVIRFVEVAGIEPASFDLVPEASPGAAGDLMSVPRRAPARYAGPSPISFPLGTRTLPRGGACFTTLLPNRRHFRRNGDLVLARQRVRQSRHLCFSRLLTGLRGPRPASSGSTDRSRNHAPPYALFKNSIVQLPGSSPIGLIVRRGAASRAVSPSPARRRAWRLFRACRSASSLWPARSRP